MDGGAGWMETKDGWMDGWMDGCEPTFSHLINASKGERNEKKKKNCKVGQVPTCSQLAATPDYFHVTPITFFLIFSLQSEQTLKVDRHQTGRGERERDKENRSRAAHYSLFMTFLVGEEGEMRWDRWALFVCCSPPRSPLLFSFIHSVIHSFLTFR